MVNHTKVIYPLSYPVDDSSDYWYVESPLSNDYRSEASRLMKEYYICKHGIQMEYRPNNPYELKGV